MALPCCVCISRRDGLSLSLSPRVPQTFACAGARQSSGKQGHAGPGSGKGKGSGKQCSGSGKKAAGPGSKGGQASAEPPPQESFYVYESVMPPEVRAP